MSTSDEKEQLSLAIQNFVDKINPECDMNWFEPNEELDNFLQGLVLCPSCVAVYFTCNHQGGICWSCKADIEIVDDYEARSMGGVAAIIVKNADQEPFLLIGSEGEGWAFGDWCEIIGKEAEPDHYDFWHC